MNELPETPEARSARALLAPLKEAAPSLAPAREAELWQRFQGQMHAPRSRLPAWLGAPFIGGLALAGAAAAAFLAFDRPVTPTGPADTASAPVARTAQTLAESLATAGGVLPSGARIEVHQGRIQVVEGTTVATRILVEAGGVTSQVPKLMAGERYLVETPQAVVSVHGTRFTVTRATPATTRIDVTEGLVSVDPPGWRPAFFLRPGESADVGPCPASAAGAAAQTADWRCTADGLTELAAAANDPLERDNLRLRAGRLVTARAPRQGAEIWRTLLTESPAGIHAEEAAYELAHALHLAGEIEAARVAGAEFRRRFPQSPRGEATKQF